MSVIHCVIIGNLCAITSNLIVMALTTAGFFREVSEPYFLAVLLGCAAIAWAFGFFVTRSLR